MGPPVLLDIKEARAKVLAHLEFGDVETVPLRAAPGRVLADDVRSADEVPPFDNSAMDGFAVRSSDIEAAEPHMPARLELAGEARAGRPTTTPLDAGQAIAISTGAALPQGADAVVRSEDTTATNGRVSIHVPVTAGTNLRRAGDDIRRGEQVLRRGSRLGPAELGILASIGQSEVPCYATPTVAILTSGDELVGADQPLRPGAIRDSNSYSLAALASDLDAEVSLRDAIPDSPRATRTAIGRALKLASVVVISGGVSVGEHDHVRGALDALGVEEEFWGIALKPGKPTWFGRNDDGVLVFGLPGNPVSSMVTFMLLVRPALERLAGIEPSPRWAQATLSATARGEPGRAHAVRCRLSLTDAGLAVTPTGDNQSSHVLTSMLDADCLAMLPPGEREWQVGEQVEIELLPGRLGSIR